VFLLSDRPLALAHVAVLEAQSEVAGRDPWELVAVALHRLQAMTEASVEQRHRQRRSDAAVTAEMRSAQERLLAL
jgi:hypothetical protein